MSWAGWPKDLFVIGMALTLDFSATLVSILRRTSMQDRPRFTGTLIISILIHIGVSFLVATLLSLTPVDYQNQGQYVIGLHPHIARSVLAAFISALLMFAMLDSQSIITAPAIVLSTCAAFLAQQYKLDLPRNAPLEQDVDKRGDGATGQRDEHAKHDQDQDDRG